MESSSSKVVKSFILSPPNNIHIQRDQKDHIPQHENGNTEEEVKVGLPDKCDRLCHEFGRLSDKVDCARLYDRSLVCRIMFRLSMVCIVVVLVVMVGIPKEGCEPNKPPQFQVNSFTIDHFGISASASQITANWNIVLSIKNPNGLGAMIFYDYLNVLVSYQGQLISGLMFKAFEQEQLEETVLHSSLGLSSVSVSKNITKGIEDEMSKTGVVNFEVEVQTRVRIFLERFLQWRYVIKASCENLEMRFLSNRSEGKISQSPLLCKTRKHEVTEQLKI